MPECYQSGKHKWIVDRLVAEFGTDNVRLSISGNYGLDQSIGVCLNDWKHAVALTLSNEDCKKVKIKSDEDLTKWIAEANRYLRGFGA